MSAMNNFKQAVSELFGTKETPESLDMAESGDFSTDSAPIFVTRDMDEPKSDHKPESPAYEKNNDDAHSKSIKNLISKTSKEAPMVSNAESDKNQMKTTTISSDTSLSGELRSDGHVEILGSLIGNVKAKGNIKICGKVVGDIEGNDIELVSCKVQGNITATASVFINNESIIVGNVIASDMVLDGKLKGDISLEKSIAFKENATLLGKVSAGTISIKEGAKLFGEIQIENSNNSDAVFQEI